MSAREWTVAVRLLRQRPLDDAESASVGGHVASWAARAWSSAPYALARGEGEQLFTGQFALALDFDQQDGEWLGQALDELAGLVKDARLEVDDSLALIAWDGEHFGLNGGVHAPRAPVLAAAAPADARAVFADPRPAPSSSTGDVTANSFFGDALPPPVILVQPGERLAGTPPPVPAATAAPPVDADLGVDAALVARFETLQQGGDTWDQRKSILTHAPLEVVRAGLQVLPTLKKRLYDVTATVREALQQLPDRSPVRGALAALWQGPVPPARLGDRDGEREWWNDLASLMEPCASDPGVLAALRAVLDEPPQGARTRAAIDLLAYARAAWSEAVPMLVALARRDRERSERDAEHRKDVQASLGKLGRPEALPTLVLELGAEAPTGWYPTLQALARSAGDAALPWLRRVFDLPGAAEYVVDALEYLTTDAARDWLRELAGHPEPRLRMVAGRYLGRLGSPEKARVAALWKTLDAINFEQDSSFREGALEHLGVKRGQPAADWDTLVRGDGLTPMELPPVGDPVAALTSRCDFHRTRSLERLGRTAPAPLLLALALGCELDAALQLRGYARTSHPYWNELAGRVPGWPFTGWTEPREVAVWLRAQGAAIVSQTLSPELEDVWREGATAIAAGFPDPRVRLGADEQVIMDAAERALLLRWDASRAGALALPVPVAASGPLAREAPELFGVTLEPAPHEDPPLPELRPASFESAADPVLGLVPGATRLDVERLARGLHTLYLRSVLENRLGRPIQLDSLDVVVRGQGGALIDEVTASKPAGLWRYITFERTYGFSNGTLDGAHSIDLVASYQVPFRARVLALELPAVDVAVGPPLQRTPWVGTPRELAPGWPDIAVEVALAHQPGSGTAVSGVVAVTLRAGARAPVAAEVVVAALNRGGSVIEQHAHKVTLEEGVVSFVHLAFYRETRAVLRRLDVAVAGTVLRKARVATVLLPT